MIVTKPPQASCGEQSTYTAMLVQTRDLLTHSLIAGKQFVPPSDLAPSTQIAQLQQAHPPCGTTGVADDDGLPLILRTGQDVRSESVGRDDLNSLRAP